MPYFGKKWECSRLQNGVCLYIHVINYLTVDNNTINPIS